MSNLTIRSHEVSWKKVKLHLIVADQIDISAHYAITNPGTYVVQFNGTGLQIGQPLPSWTTPALFGEDEGQLNVPFDFFSLTNQIPSEPIQIEVLAGHTQ